MALQHHQDGPGAHGIDKEQPARFGHGYEVFPYILVKQSVRMSNLAKLAKIQPVSRFWAIFAETSIIFRYG